MNQEAFLWRNEIRKSINDSLENFLSIQLKGPPKFIRLGSKISLFGNGATQFIEQSPVRGYSSSMDYRLHFGVGNTTAIDSLKIQWPDDKVQVLRNVKSNQLLTVKNEEANETPIKKDDAVVNTLFSDVTGKFNIDFSHIETKYFDFGYQRALPQKYSQLGPPVASGDFNGDGLMDFFIGGAAYQSGKVFIQNANGNFTSVDLVKGMKNEEDLGAVFFDADGDKDLDLLITGGSTEFGGYTGYNHPALFNK